MNAQTHKSMEKQLKNNNFVSEYHSFVEWIAQLVFLSSTKLNCLLFTEKNWNISRNCSYQCKHKLLFNFMSFIRHVNFNWNAKWTKWKKIKFNFKREYRMAIIKKSLTYKKVFLLQNWKKKMIHDLHIFRPFPFSFVRMNKMEYKKKERKK